MPRNEGNVLLEMEEIHFWSVETPTKKGVHRPNSDVSLSNPMVGEMVAHVQGFCLKVIIADFLRFFELPDHQRIAGGRVCQHDSGD